MIKECCDVCEKEIELRKDYIRMEVRKTECGETIGIVLCDDCSKYFRRLLADMGEAACGNGIKNVDICVYENETKT